MTTIVVNPAATATQEQPTDLPPCPSWCRHQELYSTHAYDSRLTADMTTETRYHVSGKGLAYVVQDEYNRAGVVTLGPARISMPVEAEFCEKLTAEQARDRVADLRAAADLLDGIKDQG